MYHGMILMVSFFAAIWILVLAWIVLCIVASWRIFRKAGQPGWASIVPFYNRYIEYKIYWGNGWLFAVPLILGLITGVPIVGTICGLLVLIIRALTCYKRAVAFGQGIGFAIGLFFLPAIFAMILAFGNYTYRGIPQDGTSYQQMKRGYEKFRTREKAYTYEAPNAEKKPDVSYEAPNAEKKPDVPYEAPDAENTPSAADRAADAEESSKE